MIAHIKRLSAFLIYTLIFNVVSFIFYFIPAYLAHDFFGAKWLIFGITQIGFTILFFNKVPLFKQSNEKGYKTDLVLYFLIICVLGIAAAIYKSKTNLWFTYIFFNTYFTFDIFNTLWMYIGICITENALKTFFLYRNSSKKSLSKPILITLSIITILTYAAFFVWLVLFK
ncbi:MAG: hypothetical protein K2I73_00380 [Eubacterium sp.]|nr:hypothetical protein [Eubacterium sp.]